MTLRTEYLRSEKQNEMGHVDELETSSKFWKKLKINEWTFSMFLFVLSLGFVTGKLIVNYGNGNQCSVNVFKSGQSLPAFSGTYDIFAVPNSRNLSSFGRESVKIASETLMNVSSHYGDAMTDVIVGIIHRYGWLFKAASSGIAVMSFSWFIIYKDSSVPGVNPPSPFRPSKRRHPENSRLQINYLMGVLIGVLVFVHMCL